MKDHAFFAGVAHFFNAGGHFFLSAAVNEVNLFRDWSAEDLAKIRDKGKIPDLSQWPGAPLDDLMSISALESFAADQTALDERIQGLVN